MMMVERKVENYAARLALCMKLVPRIIETTIAFYGHDKPHPYLEALAQGGHIYSHAERDTKDTEFLTIVEASGFRDTLMPDKFEKIGIPSEVAIKGLMWVLMKKDAEYEKDFRKNPGERKWEKIDHAFSYWDGSQWQTRRRKKEAADAEAWEDKWEESELTDEETNAIKTVVSQTQDVHAIAEVFEADKYAFQDMILEFPRDILNLGVLSRGLQFAHNTPRYGHTLAYDHIPAYMRFYGTGYQNQQLVNIARALSTHNSFRLDSGGLMNASYHTSSMPPTPEMLEGGINIPLTNIHPPVPAEFVNSY
jgi:hypothetical protein